MEKLPFLLSSRHALEVYNETSEKTDAFCALVVGILTEDGKTNPQIRELLDIKHAYTVSYYRKAAKALTEEQLNLWHKNPLQITLGHVRAICRMKKSQREGILRKLLATKLSVATLEKMAATGTTEDNSDDLQAHFKRYAEHMSQQIGRIVDISYNAKNGKMGRISVSWNGYEDLDNIAKALGFNPEDHL